MFLFLIFCNKDPKMYLLYAIGFLILYYSSSILKLLKNEPSEPSNQVNQVPSESSKPRKPRKPRTT